MTQPKITNSIQLTHFRQSIKQETIHASLILSGVLILIDLLNDAFNCVGYTVSNGRSIVTEELEDTLKEAVLEGLRKSRKTSQDSLPMSRESNTEFPNTKQKRHPVPMSWKYCRK